MERSPHSEHSAPRALYRRHRPRTFAELVGQEAVGRTLENAIAQGKVHHAYLFVGSRGTGKTSTAKILAAALNCEEGPTPAPCGRCPSCRAIAAGTSLDVVELDAASNNSVDDVRALRESISFAPARSSYRVYILDEAHMLSTAAWNALLKTLEEPPGHAVFVLATTEAHRVPPTVVDRCQRFDFRAPAPAQVAEVLRRVAAAEQIDLEEEVVQAVARHARGSYRDALATLEQLITYAGHRPSFDDLATLLGLLGEDELEALFAALQAGSAGEAVLALEPIVGVGRDPLSVLSAVEERGRDLLFLSLTGSLPAGVAKENAREERLRKQATALGEERLMALLDQLALARETVRAGGEPRLALELALVRACRGERRGGAPSHQRLEEGLQPLASRLKGAQSQPPQTEVGGGGGAHGQTAPSPLGAHPPERSQAPGAEGKRHPSGPTFASVREGWGKVVAELAKRGSLAGRLLAAAKPLALEDGVLTVGFPPSQAFSRKKAQAPALLAEATSALVELCGGPLELRYVVSEELSEEGEQREEEVVDALIEEFDAVELGAEEKER